MKNVKKVVLVLGISTVLAASSTGNTANAIAVTQGDAIEKVITAKFFIRIDRQEQQEDGTTHYANENYVRLTIGKITEAKQINKKNTKNYLDVIKEMIRLPEGTEDETKTAYIKWYVIKQEPDAWHVDGVWVDKKTGEELPQGPVEYNTPAPETKTQEPKETEVQDHTMVIPAEEDTQQVTPEPTIEQKEKYIKNNAVEEEREIEPQEKHIAEKKPCPHPKESGAVEEENVQMDETAQEMPELG